MKPRMTAAAVAALLSGCAHIVPIDRIVDGDVTSGRIVTVRGHLSLAFEGQSIHATREACEAGETTRALWVDVSRSEIPLAWRDCAFAEVSGVFRADETGHFDGWPSGSITSVSELRAIEPGRIRRVPGANDPDIGERPRR